MSLSHHQIQNELTRATESDTEIEPENKEGKAHHLKELVFELLLVLKSDLPNYSYH